MIELPPAYTLNVSASLTDGEAIADCIRETSGMEPVLIEALDNPTVCVETYFEDDVAARLVASILKEQFPSCEPAVHPLEHRDWTTFWRHHFKPMNLGQRLWIAPEWEQDAAPVDRPIRVILNPGLSFGTGNHFTTRFCLEILDDMCANSCPTSLLDAGCGSGVIAIAAARFGVQDLLGLDFDPVAVEQSQENAERNDVQIPFEIMDLTQTRPSRSFQVVFANLYDELLMRIAPALVALTEETLVMTGIRDLMADGVAQCFIGFGMDEVRRDGDGEWAGLVMKKKAIH